MLNDRIANIRIVPGNDVWIAKRYLIIHILFLKLLHASTNSCFLTKSDALRIGEAVSTRVPRLTDETVNEDMKRESTV